MRGTFQFPIPSCRVAVGQIFHVGGTTEELTQQWSSRFEQEVRVRIQMKTSIDLEGSLRIA